MVLHDGGEVVLHDGGVRWYCMMGVRWCCMIEHSLRVLGVTLVVAGTHHIRHAGHDGLHLVKELVPLR